MQKSSIASRFRFKLGIALVETITAQVGFALLLVVALPVGFLSYYSIACDGRTFLLVAGAVAVVVTGLLAKAIASPLRALTSAMPTLAQGEFIASKALNRLAERSGQIGRLGRAFLDMVVAVQQRDQRLRDEVATLTLQIDGPWQVEVLLKELLSSDIQWLKDVGAAKTVEMGQTLDLDTDLRDTVAIILDGTLAPADAHKMASSGEICLSSGEVFGAPSTVSLLTSCSVLKAVATTLLWEVPKSVFDTKLTYDSGFAARFFKALAVLQCRRLVRLSEATPHSADLAHAPIRDMLLVLGELHDSDIDWLVAQGQRRKVSAGKGVISVGGPIDGLFILLEGSLALFEPKLRPNPLVHTLLTISDDENQQVLVRPLYKGEMFGIEPFVNAPLPSGAIAALEESLVLHVPRQSLMTKLDQDVGFAARFYGVVTNMLISRIQHQLFQQDLNQGLAIDPYVGNGKAAHHELNFDTLDQMAMAGTRLSWMIDRLSGTELS